MTYKLSKRSLNNLKDVHPDLVRVVKSITLSSEFGSTSTTSDIKSNGNGVEFKITCSGTGFAAWPNFTINKIIDSSPLPKISSKVVENTGSTCPAVFLDHWSTKGHWFGAVHEVPVATTYYVINAISA